jgi:hypothetical protein
LDFVLFGFELKRVDQLIPDSPLATPDRRSRILCGAMIGIIVPLGLATRALPWLPEFIRVHAGDALWAAMVYWGGAFVFPRLPVWSLVTAAASFSLAIELSQLSSHPILAHARATRYAYARELRQLRHPILAHARATRLGALVLGHGFLWVDLLRYATGIILAAMLDVVVVRLRSPKQGVQSSVLEK